MVVKLPCKICNKAVANNHHAVQCDKCHLWVHMKCSRINPQTYKFLQKCSYAWYCPKCYEGTIPFATVSNEELYQTNQGRKIKSQLLQKRLLLITILLISSMVYWMILCQETSRLNTMSLRNLHL